LGETLYLENPVQVKVHVSFSRDFVVKDYTGKLVKSLLISGHPPLEKVFARGAGFPPKPIHVSPLYTDTEKGVRAVYSRWVAKDLMVRGPASAADVRPVRLTAERMYFFYVGTSAELLGKVLAALAEVSRFTFGHVEVEVSRLSYEVSYVNVEREAEETRKAIESTGQLKVVFESPTLLRDPLALYGSRFKLLIPLPEAVLATPLMMYLLDTGRYRRSLLIKLAIYIRSALSIPYSAMGTTRVVWYVYNGKLLPAMIGYAKYHVNPDAVARSSAKLLSKYSLDLLDCIAKAVALSKVYGAGGGRASGFGHISWHQPGRSASGSLADMDPMAGKPGP